MDEITISDDDGTSSEQSSAHDAAVAEGAAAVHKDIATDASAEAKEAAQAALETTKANIDAAQVAHEAADRAEAAAEQSGITLDMVHQALVSQGTAISALTNELKAGRKETRPAVTEPVQHASDEAPKPKKPKTRGFILR